MAGKVGAPYGNKNAAGKRGGGLKFAPGKIHYDSPKFQAAARRQQRAGSKTAYVIKFK
jgi:hypothetical protein